MISRRDGEGYAEMRTRTQWNHIHHPPTSAVHGRSPVLRTHAALSGCTHADGGSRLYVRMKQRVDMRIDVELLDRVDEARGDTTRTAFTEQALAAALGTKPPQIVKSYVLRDPAESQPPPTSQEAESGTSPEPLEDRLVIFEQKVKAKRAKGKTRRLAEIEAREELGL